MVNFYYGWYCIYVFLPAFMTDTAKNCSRLCILPRTLNCYHQQSLSMLKIKSLSSSQIRFHVCGVLVVIVVKRPSTTIFLYIRSRSEKLNLVVVLRTVSSKTFLLSSTASYDLGIPDKRPVVSKQPAVS